MNEGQVEERSLQWGGDVMNLDGEALVGLCREGWDAVRVIAKVAIIAWARGRVSGRLYIKERFHPPVGVRRHRRPFGYHCCGGTIFRGVQNRAV